MLSASDWSIVCERLITLVPFYREKSQQGGFKENSTGEHVQENDVLGEGKGERQLPEEHPVPLPALDISAHPLQATVCTFTGSFFHCACSFFLFSFFPAHCFVHYPMYC